MCENVSVEGKLLLNQRLAKIWIKLTQCEKNLICQLEFSKKNVFAKLTLHANGLCNTDRKIYTAKLNTSTVNKNAGFIQIRSRKR